MANLSIIRMIAMAVVFGLFMTTSDQISDLFVMINKYIFCGNTLGIVASKYCSNPEGSIPMNNKSMIENFVDYDSDILVFFFCSIQYSTR